MNAAIPPPAASDARPPAQYLGFTVAGDPYAIPILRVREILRYEPVTHVPATPPFILGVMNVRGAVLPVIDLAARLGLPRRPITRWSCVLVVESTLDGETAVLGLLADVVRQVVELSDADVEPTPPFGVRIRLDYLSGMGKLGAGFVLLLDLDRVLSAEELLAVTAAAAQTPAPPPEAAPA